VVARDELVLNTGQQRFGVELVAPRSGDRVGAEVTARARVAVPADQRLRRLEYYLGEEPVVVVEEPPFDAAVRLAGVNGTTAVRAVAHLADGRTAEDTVLVNAPDVVDEVGVHLVELFTAVVDRRGRGIEGLAAADFRVREDGAAQELVRFDRVDGLPVHASLVLDVSGSMGEVLDDVRRAALGFLERALTPRDRASIVTFDHQPRQVVDFTADFNRLANGLAGLRAHGGTALHAGLLFALRQFDGVEGQKVALLFSDGQEKEELESEAVLEYARRSGVTVYTIGFRLPWGEDSGRVLLRRLAEDTGGRSYFVADTGALATAYADIERDMRSRYLLAYQSSNPSGGGFRVVDVELSRPGLEARTVRGYYP
jgi:Ca-activated chloride channel family protein